VGRFCVEHDECLECGASLLMDGHYGFCVKPKERD
jgi:hypothetical protein